MKTRTVLRIYDLFSSRDPESRDEGYVVRTTPGAEPALREEASPPVNVSSHGTLGTSTLIERHLEGRL